MTSEKKTEDEISNVSKTESASESGKKPRWYNDNLTNVPDEGRKLLESYSGIAPSDVVEHVCKIRDKAFSIYPYPCIGQVRFVNYVLPRMPYYKKVISRLHDGATFLDAACGFAQNMRFLTHDDHIPSKQLYGFDLEPQFIEIGFDLFLDRGRLGATLLTGDLLVDREAESAQQINAFEGKMDIVHVSSVLHVWDWEESFQAAKRLVSFTRPIKGSLIIGRQVGSINAGRKLRTISDGFVYRHNEESMRKFWHQVGEETDTKWDVCCGLYTSTSVKENFKKGLVDEDMRMIWFIVERL